MWYGHKAAGPNDHKEYKVVGRTALGHWFRSEPSLVMIDC